MLPNDRLKAMATAPLGPLLARFSWPALVSMTLNALYAVVDRVFIGQGCGVDVIAGLQLAMPVMMLFGAFGVFVGAGKDDGKRGRLAGNPRHQRNRAVYV